MRNKQKAWRLGAIAINAGIRVTGRGTKAVKGKMLATLLGSTIRRNGTKFPSQPLVAQPQGYTMQYDGGLVCANHRGHSFGWLHLNGQRRELGA